METKNPDSSLCFLYTYKDQRPEKLKLKFWDSRVIDRNLTTIHLTLFKDNFRSRHVD